MGIMSRQTMARGRQGTPILIIGVPVACPCIAPAVIAPQEGDIERVNEELKNKFDRDSLEHGRCPVCSTQLIDLAKKGGK